MLDDPEDDDDGMIDEDDWDDLALLGGMVDGRGVLHVIHSEKKLNWVDRVLGVRDVSTDMDDPDECS